MSDSIYISFTCLPCRINNLSYIINYIFKQTLHFDKLIINYPKNILRLNANSNIEQVNKIINNSDYQENIYLNITHDYGPITKIFPLIYLNFIKLNDIIIIIDDDNHYNYDLFKNLYNEFIKHNNIAICVSGLLYPTKLNSLYQCCKPNSYCQLMEASFGYIIRRNFLESDLNNWIIKANIFQEIKDKNFFNSFLSDDYVISRYLDIKNIKKKVINYTFELNKNNSKIKDVNIKSTDSLCGLGHNLDKYVKSEIELKIKNLV
jgi:hypothetical protein